ncbi:MAG: hypothetical protein JW940_29560 [Polyangiaceae bacterium]|nr:hypothetical protein [Polyangiaceae bacterium]
MYKDLGSPAQLTRAQVARINAASSGNPVAELSVTIGPDGTFDRELGLRDNDVFLVTLSRQGRSARSVPSPAR